MHKIIPFVVILSLATKSFGQVEWIYNNPYLQDYCHLMIKTSLNNLVIVHGESPKILTILDEQGEELFSNEDFDLGGDITFDAFLDIFELSDHTLAAPSMVYVFDPSTGWAYGFDVVVKFNQSGEVLGLIQGFSQHIDKGIAIPNGGFMIADLTNNLWVTRFSSDGNILWDKYINGYKISDIAILNSGSYLLTTNQGLLIINDVGNIVNQYPSLIFDRVKTNQQDDIIFVRADSIFLYSSTLSLIAKTGFAGDAIQDFSIDNGKIAVLTNGKSIQSYDSNLAFLDSFQLFDEAQFDFIHVDSNKLTFAGTERFGGTQHNLSTRTSFVKEFDLDGDDFGVSNDIGIIGIVPGTEVSVGKFQSLPGAYQVIFKDIAVTVKNYGNNPVTSLSLHCKHYNTKFVDSINIAPGGELTLNWDEIVLYFYSGDPSGQTIDLCMWTSHPGLKMDTDATNDTYCADFLVSDKEAMYQNEMKVYPNPTVDEVNISYNYSSYQPSNFYLVNAFGQTVRNWEALNLPTKQSFSLNGLPDGIYFWSLESEGQKLGTGKLIIHH